MAYLFEAMAAPFAIDLTGRDWDKNLEALKAAVRQRAPDAWNSFSTGDLGTALLELMAYDASMLSYLIDSQANECFLDTLKQRESLVHFARLTGYRLRRATASTLPVYCRTRTAPTASDISFIVPKGTQVRSKDNQRWEVAQDYSIAPGNFTPVTVEAKYGDVKGVTISSDGSAVTEDAFIMLQVGKAYAVLVNPQGQRYNSQYNFGERISQGSILVAMDTWNVDDEVFSAPPPTAQGEFAVVQVSKFDTDVYNASVLYLDRPYDGADDFIGKWRIENRNIVLVQGETKVESFVVPDGVDRSRYNFALTYYPVLSGSSSEIVPAGFFQTQEQSPIAETGVTVKVNGEEWDPTPNLLFSGPTAKAYEYDFDSLDRMTITFGDGVFGAMVPEDATISVTYRVGGGPSGNLPQNSVDTTLVTQLYGNPTTPITAYLSNPYTIGTGGQDRETILDAKRNIPLFVRSNDRAVTGDDYGFLASTFNSLTTGSIAMAKGVVHRNKVPREANIVWVYAWVRGPSGQLVPPTYQLKVALQQFLNERKMKTDEVVVVDGLTTTVPVHVRYKFKAQADFYATQSAVQAALNGVFTQQKPGERLFISKLYEAVNALDDVEYVNIFSPGTDLYAENDFELFVNSLQVPVRTRLTERVFKGQTVINVAETGAFYTGGPVGMFEVGKLPSVSFVESIDEDAGQITLRSPIAESYSLFADCVSGDFLVDGWAYERPLNIFVRHRSYDPSQAIARNVYRAINQYFRVMVKPNSVLYRADLLSIVNKVQDIQSPVINIESLESPTEQLTSGPLEVFTLGNLSINGVTFAPIPEL